MAHAGFIRYALEQTLQDRRTLHRGGLVHHNDRAGNTSRSPERLAKAGVEFSKRLPKRSTTSKVEIVTSAGGGVPSSRPSSRH
jgi:hypothetical protein